MTTIIHRLVAGLGRLLITVGALVLAFAAFQYWGTGLAEARAQEELDGEFLARLAEVRDDADGADDVAVDDRAADDPADDEPDPPTTGSGARPLGLNDIPRAGEAAGRIIIPSIDVDKTYVEGVGRDDLRKGPGHYPATAFPGQPGNAAIAGHRTTYGAPFFDLDRLVPGDEIIVETLQGRFTYLVNEHPVDEQVDPDGTEPPLGHFIVDPTATWVLDDHGDSRLTLTACHPKRSAAQRIVVTATLESDPASGGSTPTDVDESTPVGAETEAEPSEAADAAGQPTAIDDLVVDDSESLEESLGWQTEHWPATALWAGLCALVALVGWLIGRSWRRWPAILITAGPFLTCLFVCFTHLDKLLPAI